MVCSPPLEPPGCAPGSSHKCMHGLREGVTRCLKIPLHRHSCGPCCGLYLMNVGLRRGWGFQGGMALLIFSFSSVLCVWHKLQLYDCVVLSLCHCPCLCQSHFHSTIPPGVLSWHCGQTSLLCLRDLCQDLCSNNCFCPFYH